MMRFLQFLHLSNLHPFNIYYQLHLGETNIWLLDPQHPKELPPK